MKISEIVERYDLDESAFTGFLNRQEKIKVSGIFSPSIPDEDVYEAVQTFLEGPRLKAEQEKKKKEEHEARMREELQRKEERRLAEEKAFREKQIALSSMLISSGFSFDGYRIVKYSGYISGDDAVQIPRSGLFNTANNGQNLTDALVKIRIQAIKELKEAAYALGCNAVVGVDFDYITLEPQTANLTGGTTYEPYVICVTANGNAVVIEKE